VLILFRLPSSRSCANNFQAAAPIEVAMWTRTDNDDDDDDDLDFERTSAT
jgi:hypothetical protein